MLRTDTIASKHVGPTSKNGWSWLPFCDQRHLDDLDDAFRIGMGRWTTAATLVHELAHANGADGVTRDAGATLGECMLSGLEDPTVIGMLRGIQSGTRLA